ncbi:hypothetical protein GGX14DRAFT_661279, partial [Mycena pura]
SKLYSTCGNDADAVPLFITTGGPINDCVLTTSNADVTSLVGAQGFTFGGVSARVFPTQELSTMPMFLAYEVDGGGSITDHLYTISVTEFDDAIALGFRDEGIQGYIYPTQICGSVPYYRLYKPALTEHFYTVSETQQQSMVAAGWTDQGIMGYVLSPNCTD